jgi:protein phosphatase
VSSPIHAHAPSFPRRSSLSIAGARALRLEAFGLSHAGAVRQGNEDAYLVAAGAGLCAVADGMGGRACGEVASRMTVEVLRAALEEADATWPGAPAGRPPSSRGVHHLVASVERANAQVFEAATSDATKEGMGTTVTALLMLGDRAAIAHVGDSRAYRLRGHRLECLTHDHTLIEEYLRAGAMTRAEAAASPHRHILSRAVGAESAVQVDHRLIAVEPGDTFLLATDGLHGVVADEMIAAIMLAEPDPTRMATWLIDAALDAGGPDNVTVVVCRALAAPR